MSHRFRPTFPLFACLSLASLPANGDWVTVMEGDFKKVSVSEEYLGVETDTEIRLLNHLGQLLQRVPKPGIPATHRRQDLDDPDEKRLIESLDLQDRDPESRSAEYLLDQERRLRSRRVARSSKFQPDRPHRGHLVWTLDGRRLWLGFAGGLFLWDGNIEKVRDELSEATAIMAANGLVLIRSGGRIRVFDHPNNLHYDLDPDVPPTHLGVSASGARIALASEETVVLYPNPRSGEPVRIAALGKVADLGFCGEDLLLLLGEAVLAITPDGAKRWSALPHPARRVLCSPASGKAWILEGKDFFRSVDEGKSWQVYGMPPSLLEREIAVSDYGAWLASDAGLFFCPWDEWSLSGAAMAKPGYPRRRQVDTWWTAFLPKVSLDASIKRRNEREEIRGFVQANFSLDHPRRGRLASLEAAEGRTVPLESASFPTPSLPSTLPEKARACLVETRRQAVRLSFGEPERARSYLRRAARAAWLPEVRVVFDRRFGRSESIDYPGSNVSLTSPLGVDTVNDVRYEARATWDLARLVFAPEEMSAQTQVLRMAEQRREVELQVNRLFFERQRLQRTHEADPGKALKNNLRQQEIAGELDILSGNVFSSCTSSPTEANE